MPTRAVYLVFLLSGISGLIYQVIWVRCFARIFGNTIYSASLVIAVFMCGLGLGSYLAGIWIDRRYAGKPTFPLRAYAYAEFAIGVLGALIALLLPALEPISAYISFYAEGARGWHELSTLSLAFRFGIAILILAPITTLMGATLTLLIRYLLRSNLDLAGWRIAFLYGFNTAGAALGAFATDFALIPHFGLFATQMLAVALNLLAAFAALRLVESSTTAPVAAHKAPTATPRDTGDSTPTAIAFTGLAIFLSGFCAMGVEILWFRHLTITVGSYRSVFSLLLTVILVGIWLGSLAGGYCHRRFGRPAMLYMLTQTVFVTSTLVLLAFGTIERGTVTLDPDVATTSFRHQLLVTWGILQPILIVVGLPAFLMGFAYPLANANIQRADRHVGRRAGLLYLANTLGAVLGSLAAGFLLLPRLGLKGSVAVLAIVGAAAIAALYGAMMERKEPGPHRRTSTAVFASCVVCVLIGAGLWLRVPNQRFQRIGLNERERVLAVSEGVYELIAVTELPSGKARRLNTNGHSMSSTENLAQRYMRAFSHVPLLLQQEPTDVLVICFGVGSTLHAASLHPTVKRLEVVDLSRHVLEHASYFERWNHGILDDPRVSVFVNDGRQHLWMRSEGSYDLVTLEPPPIAFAGVSALYSREFYELARSRLREGGFMSQWLPAYQLPEAVVRAMVRAFLDVFPNAVLLSGDRQELILLGAKAPSFAIDPAMVHARLDRHPDLRADLSAIHLGTTTEIVGMFLGSSEALRRATAGVQPVTDDYPLMEYAAPTNACWQAKFPEDLIDLASLDVWCPKCVVDGKLSPLVAPLRDYLVVLASYYQSKSFLEYSNCSSTRPVVDLPLPPDSAVFRQTSYLKRIFVSR